MTQLSKRFKKELMKPLILGILGLGATLSVDPQHVSSYASQRDTQTASNESLSTYPCKWDLSEIYRDRKSFETDIMKIKIELLPKFSYYQGELSNPLKLKEFLVLDENTKMSLHKAYSYAVLDKDLNLGKIEDTELIKLVEQLYYEYYDSVYFAENELGSMSKETLNALITDPELIDYKRYFEKLCLKMSHTLNVEEELRLAQMNITNGDPKMRFDVITNVEYKNPAIKAQNGKNIILTASIYNACVTSHDRELRKVAYEAVMASFKKQVNSLASNYANQVYLDNMTAKSRAYPTALEASLSENELTLDTYNQLVNAVNSNLEGLHKYYEIRKKYLGLEQMYSYDIMVPIVEEINYKFSYESAVKVFNNALIPLGSNYLNDLNKGINSTWIHLLPQESDIKANYLWYAFDVHPFILLKYNDRLEEVLTLNRALGNGMNRLYSNQSQRYLYADVPNATEQVAEYVNDLLIMNYFIENAKTDQQRLFFINYQIQSIKKILFNNVLNAEFEQKTHEIAESKGNLSAEELNTLWLDLTKKYGGEYLIVPEEGKYNWSRIEAFYTPYKSYLPALNLTAAYTIVNNLSTPNAKITSVDYLNYLRTGDSLKPLESLKMTGVDLESIETTINTVNYFNALVDEYERLLMANKAVSKPTK